MEKSNEHLQKTEYSDLLTELTKEVDEVMAEFHLDGDTPAEKPHHTPGHKAPSRLSPDQPTGWESITGRLPHLKKETGKLPTLKTETGRLPRVTEETQAEHAASSEESATSAQELPREDVPQEKTPKARPRINPFRWFWTELKEECVTLRSAISAFLLRWSDSFRQGNVNFREVVSAKRNHGFPESSHFLLQLLLFVWGMLPCIFSLATARLLHRRSRTIRRGSRMTHFTEKLHMHPGWFLGCTGVLAAVVIFFSLYTFGTEVSFRGQPLGTVKESEDALVALRRVEKATKDAVNNYYSLDETNVTTALSLSPRSDLLTVDDLEHLISEKVGLIKQAYALYINEELICSTEYEYVLEDLLQQLQYAYTTENTVSSDFEEKVDIRYEYVPSRTVKRIGEIADILNSSHTEEVVYQVKAGDVWSRIANDNGMTSAELLKLNPGYNPAMLHVGDELLLSAAVPYLTTTFTEQQHYVADVPYDIEYQKDPNMWEGDTKVLSAGVYGKADVLADVTYKNGEEIDRVVRSYTKLTEPVTELQALGTKERPSWHASGTFRRPCSGTITSYYGGRNLWGSYNNHGGLDIANRKGTPIYAADGGTVKFAGWQGTYGYLVIIDHGNGFETYYAHNSSLTCRKGDKVHKGEQIAKMGSTGRVSGSHCHFEVRYKGERRNPLNYI